LQLENIDIWNNYITNR